MRRPKAPTRTIAKGPRFSPGFLAGWRSRATLGILLVLVLFSSWNYLRPLPDVGAVSTGLDRYVITGTAPSLPWPQTGSAAVGVSNLGLIATSGQVAPSPAASIAKVMTALVVLNDKPLARDQLGPSLIMTDQDVATYTADVADQQSVVPVALGERLTEFEALEALLIPSGNNIAETLARWDAGNVPAFVTKMNQLATTLHLAKTTFADPAGVSTQTVSTPADLVALGMAAMQQDVITEIVSLPQTTLPVAGVVYNVNGALGQNGIVGIKTGFGLGTGADFLFAAQTQVDNRQVTLYGCVMGQPTLDTAFSAAEALVGAMEPAVKARALVTRGDVVALYETAWGTQTNVIATQSLAFVEWPGMTLHMQINATRFQADNLPADGTPAGTLHVVLGDQAADVPLVTNGSVPEPNVIWRLFRVNL
jgi:serine-type D-Ala-D-Ala carboxypeptidase (penicillin-binding protein 5/6)